MRRRFKVLAFKVFNRLGNKQLFEGFNVWAGALHEAKAKEHREMELRYASEAERQIEAAKQAEAERKRLHGLRAIQKLVHCCLATTLSAWINYTKQCKHERMVVLRFARKLKFRQASMCFSTWQDFCSQRDMLRRIIRRLFGGRLSKLMLGAFKTWYDGMREQDKTLHIIRKFALRMKNQKLAKIFVCWSAYAYEEKANRLIVKRFASRMANAAIFRCLRRWMHFKDQRIKVRRLMQKCVGGKRTIALSAALKTWHRAAVAFEMREMQLIIESDKDIKTENEELKARVQALEESNEVVHKQTNLLMSPAVVGSVPGTPMSLSYSPVVKFNLETDSSSMLRTPGLRTPGSNTKGNLSLWEESERGDAKSA